MFDMFLFDSITSHQHQKIVAVFSIHILTPPWCERERDAIFDCKLIKLKLNVCLLTAGDDSVWLQFSSLNFFNLACCSENVPRNSMQFSRVSEPLMLFRLVSWWKIICNPQMPTSARKYFRNFCRENFIGIMLNFHSSCMLFGEENIRNILNFKCNMKELYVSNANLRSASADNAWDAVVREKVRIPHGS